MRVGLLTSWQEQCGIAEYSSHLAGALKRAGAVPIILGSTNDCPRRPLPPHDPANEHLPVERVFDVQAWRADSRHEFDVDRVLALDLDVLHVQYEVVLFHRQRLQELLDRFDGVKAITYHDNCIPPDMPGPFDLAFRHRADTGPAGEVIPMGVENVPPVVKTFGLGRSRADLICAICDRHDWTFEQSFGDQRWLGQAELHAWLRDADLIVLWYPEVDSAGSSLAARTALATRRPLIVNDTRWFADLPGRDAGVLKVQDNPAVLEAVMHDVLDSPYIDAWSWDEVARYHLDAYTKADAHRERPLAV